MSLLIKDVQVVDGSGGEPYGADVLVQKNIISAIGKLKNRGASKVIEGLGHYLLPGFIDVDTDPDHYLSLFNNPSQSDFTDQGVTTIIGGNCGASLAPIIYGTLESIEDWGDSESINVNWHSISEFLNNLKRFKLGVNFGTLVGHTTIRRSIVGEDSRRLTKLELDVFKNVLGESLEGGAFGLSTGLGYVHAKLVPQSEILELTDIVKKYDCVYATHLRDETHKLTDSINETIKISKKIGVKTLISHLQPFIGFEDQYIETLNRIGDESSETNLRFDLYPFDTSARAIYTLLPEWVQVKNNGTMLERIRNEKTKKLIHKELSDINPETITISGAPNYNYLVGKTLKELSQNMEMDAANTLLKIIEVTRLNATVFNRNINPSLISRAVMHKRSFIGSNGNSVLRGDFVKHERCTRTFPKYFDIVLKRKIAIEKAIPKITSEPASYFGIKKRGVIKEGNVADLVVLGKNDYAVKKTIVGGKIVGEENTVGEVLYSKK
jgi:N-acyl-D-amino-acid deacylase